MRIKSTIAGLGLATMLAGCATLSDGQTVAEYCAIPDNGEEAVCQLRVEMQGTETRLAETNLSVDEARRIADSALSASADAQTAADAAQSTANQAMTAAMSHDLSCETRVIQQTNIGTCREGYTLMGCSQTRYTFRAGGLSFLREVNDEQCRFNSQVLEMHVRCCTAGAPLQPDESTLIEADS
ncbi:MAG: hypothetical protein AAFO63_08775 [Pseudomonadota bacterium]